MTLDEIKSAVRAGWKVCWKSNAYRVSMVRDRQGVEHWFIVFDPTGDTIGLVWSDGVTMNGEECDFYTWTL